MSGNLKKLLGSITIVGGMLLAGHAFSGTNNIPDETGSVIRRTHINKFADAMQGDWVPRNASGVATDVGADLGQSSLRWDEIFVKEIELGPSSTTVTMGNEAGTFLTVSPNETKIDSVSSITLDADADVIFMRAGVETARITVNGIDGSDLVDDSVTRDQLVDVGEQVSSSSGNYSVNSTSYVAVTNMTVTITTTGRPVFITLIADGGSDPGYVGQADGPNTNMYQLQFKRDTTVIGVYVHLSTDDDHTTGIASRSSPPHHIDVVTAGTYTYTLEQKRLGTGNVEVKYLKMIAFEL